MSAPPTAVLSTQITQNRLRLLLQQRTADLCSRSSSRSKYSWTLSRSRLNLLGARRQYLRSKQAAILHCNPPPTIGLHISSYTGSLSGTFRTTPHRNLASPAVSDQRKPKEVPRSRSFLQPPGRTAGPFSELTLNRPTTACGRTAGKVTNSYRNLRARLRQSFGAPSKPQAPPRGGIYVLAHHIGNGNRHFVRRMNATSCGFGEKENACDCPEVGHDKHKEVHFKVDIFIPRDVGGKMENSAKSTLIV